MAVLKYLNPNYIEGGSEPKYIPIPNISISPVGLELIEERLTALEKAIAELKK